MAERSWKFESSPGHQDFLSERESETGEHASASRRSSRRTVFRRFRRHRHRNDGPRAAARPAVPGPAFGRRRRMPSGSIRQRRLQGAAPEGAPGRSQGAQDFPLRALRSRHAEAIPGRGREAGLLHQGGVEIGSNLYRPARLEGSVPRALGRRAVEAAAELGLGRVIPHRGTAALRGGRCRASPRAQSKAR